MDMKRWAADMVATSIKEAIPILSFPSVQLMDIGVDELIASSEKQAEGMALVADRTDAAASVSMMDLSVEAEAFGSQIRFSEDEVPTVIGRIVSSQAEADALPVPDPKQGRTGLYIEAVRLALEKITDRPVLAGVIGPFSLAGRLMDVSEAMINCYEDPEMVRATLRKATEFITQYILAYREIGAGGVVMSEPLAGILSPPLCAEFSSPYVKKIVDAVQTDEFTFIYHNCGNNVIDLADSIRTIGAAAYHFGNATDMPCMMELMPADALVMGNIDPAGEFKNGTPESIRQATLSLLKACSAYPNFVISSGCDIPPTSSWENIDAFFAAVKEFYSA